MSGFAWVTLATNDSYSLGALVLAHSLKQVSTAHQLAVLVTPGVTNVMRKNLADVFNVVEEVNLFDSKDEANLRLLKRPELGVTFTKLHCWRLTQFEKCVFLDADVLVLANSDELFEREEFSASPDVGWPDCFNSGVFVYRPSLETYTKLVDFAIQRGSFDGGDQGLLNAYFSDWAHKDISKHLPFIYNMCSTACYSYLPAFKYYGANVKIVHFIGPAKPWLQYFDTESRKVHPSPDLQHLQEVLQKWWDMFCSLIHPKLSPDMAQSKQSAENSPQHPSHSHSYENIPFNQSNVEDPSTVHDQNVDIRNRTSDAQSNVYNVWDPWEEYEERIASIPSISQRTNYDSSTHISELASYSELGGIESNYCENTSNVSNPDPISRIRTVETIRNDPIQHIAPVYENYPNQSVIHSQPSTSIYNSYDNVRNFEDKPVEKSSKTHFKPFTSNNNDYDNICNFDNRPVEKSRNIEHREHKEIQHQVLVNNDQYKQHKDSGTSIVHNSTPLNSSTSTTISSSRSDTFNREFHEIPKDNIDSNLASDHIPNNQTSSPSTLPTQVHSLTDISLPIVCETSANIPQDASLHTKDYDDADSKSQSGLAGAFAQFTLGEKRSPSQDALENHLRRQAWEVGNIDYMGRDSFDNIWSKICQTLSTTQLQTPDKDGAVSSSETQQIPEVKDKQQVETATVAENQEISENTAVVKTPSSEISTSIAVAEEKPKEVKDDAPKAIVQEDEVKPEDNIQKTQEIVPPKEIVTEVSKTDDRPQDAGASAEEIKSDIPVVEKTAEISETPGIPKSDGEQKKETVISQEVKTDIPEAAVESPKVEDQQVVQPDIIPENEPVQETTVPKEEAKLETSVKVDESISVETVTPKGESKLDETKIELPENVEKSATVVTQCSEVGSQVSEQIESPKAAESSQQVEESIPETQESKLEDIKPDVVPSTEVKQESEISRTEILPTEAQPPASDAITSQDIAKLEESKPDVIATAEPQQEIVASLEKEIPPSDTKLVATKSTEDLPASKEEVAEVVECRIRDPAAISIPDPLSTQPEEPEKADVTEDTKPDIITEASKEEVVEKKTTEEIASKTSIIQEQPEEPTIVQKEAEPEVIEPSSIKLETSTEEIVETQKEIEPPIAETSPIKLEPLTEKNTETIKDTGAEIAGASPNKSEPLTEKIVGVEKETEPNIAETCPIKVEPSTEKTSKIQKGTKPKTTTASLMKSESSTEKIVETQKDSESETTQTSPITSEPQKSKTVVTRKIPKEKVAPTSQVPPESPKEAKPISPTEPKVTKVVKKVKPKADSTAEAGKVQPKLEPPIEAPKSQETPKTEAATPLESVQAELSAEGSADVPKSDTKPKVKKIKKVKKVVKPAEPATESTDTPETAGASKK